MKDSNERDAAWVYMSNIASGLLKTKGVAGVAEYMAQAVCDTKHEDDILFMRLNACVKAERLIIPTTKYLNDLFEAVNQIAPTVPATRIELAQEMLATISTELCTSLIQKAMIAARHLAQSLGTSLDISASSTGPNENEWRTIDGPPASTTIH